MVISTSHQSALNFLVTTSRLVSSLLDLRHWLCRRRKEMCVLACEFWIASRTDKWVCSAVPAARSAPIWTGDEQVWSTCGSEEERKRVKNGHVQTTEDYDQIILSENVWKCLSISIWGDSKDFTRLHQIFILLFIVWQHCSAVDGVAASKLQGPGSILSLAYCLSGALHVLPMFVWVSTAFSGFLFPPQKHVSIDYSQIHPYGLVFLSGCITACLKKGCESIIP